MHCDLHMSQDVPSLAGEGNVHQNVQRACFPCEGRASTLQVIFFPRMEFLASARSVAIVAIFTYIPVAIHLLAKRRMCGSRPLGSMNTAFEVTVNSFSNMNYRNLYALYGNL